MGLNGLAFVYKLSSCRIDSCYSDLSVKCCACLGLRAPGHSGSYKVLTLSLGVNKSQEKSFLPNLFTNIPHYSCINTLAYNIYH